MSFYDFYPPDKPIDSTPAPAQPSSKPSPVTSVPQPATAPSSPPKLPTMPPRSAQEAANAMKLKDAKEAIHPMAKAIPSLRKEIEAHLVARRISNQRVWSNCAFNRDVRIWKASDVGDKPDLVVLLAARASYHVLSHRTPTSFDILLEHRGWDRWAEEQMKKRAAKEGIDLNETQKDTDEQPLPVKPQRAETLHQPESQQQQQPVLSQQPAPQSLPHSTAHHVQQPLEEPQKPLPHVSVTPAVQTTSSVQNRPPPQATCGSDEGSILPLKRSIECPSGEECPNMHVNKKIKTSDAGCQTEPQHASPSYKPAKTPANQVAGTQTHHAKAHTTPEVPPPRAREDDIITVVERLMESNHQLTQSFHYSVQEMAAERLYWQQRATAMSPSGYPYLQPVPQHAVMMTQVPDARIGIGAYRQPQRPGGGQRDRLPEQGGTRHGSRRANGTGERSSFFG